MKDLTQEISGLVENDTPIRDYVDAGAGEGTPIIPRTADPSLMSFSSHDLTTAAASVADSVSTSASSLASTVKTKASLLFAGTQSSATGYFSRFKSWVKGLFGAATTGGKAASTGDNGLMWLWLVLAAGAAYLVYHFTKGKGKGKTKIFSSFRASGSHVKPYGK